MLNQIVAIVLLLKVVPLIIGSSFYTPAQFVFLGNIYSLNDKRRESSFTMNYVVYNLGSTAGILFGAFSQKFIDYSFSFFVSSIIIFIALVVYFRYQKLFSINRESKILGRFGHINSFFLQVLILISALILVLFSSFLLKHTIGYHQVLVAIVVLMGGYFVYLTMARKQKEEKAKIVAFAIFSATLVGFWSLYMLEPSLLMVFIEKGVNRTVGGFVVPSSVFYSLDTFFVIVLGLALSYFWVFLEKKEINIAIIYKFISSILLMALGFLVIFTALKLAVDSKKINFINIIFAYICFAAAEILIAPVSFSMAGKLSPPKHEGVFIGISQLTVGVSVVLSVFFQKMVSLPEKMVWGQKMSLLFSNSFLSIVVFSTAMAILLLLVSYFIKPYLK